MDILDIISTKFPEMEYVCGPWCKKPNLILLHGERGLGKTNFLLNILACVSTGTKCMGWEVPKARPVVLFDGEMPLAQQASRSSKIFKGLHTTPLPGYFRLYNYEAFGGTLPDLASAEGQEIYERYIGSAELIVIDNLLNAVKKQSPRDSDFDQWLRIKPWLIKKRSQGHTVIIVHHTGKSGDQLGTSTKANEVDIEVALTQARGLDVTQGNGFELSYRKKRTIFDHEDSSPMFIQFYDDEFGALKFEGSSLKQNLIKRLVQLKDDLGSLRHAAAICKISYEYALLLTRGLESAISVDREVGND